MTILLWVLKAYLGVGVLWASVNLFDFFYGMPKDLENDTPVSKTTALVVGALLMLVLGTLFWSRGLWGMLRKR